jgi:hypothetical protein
LIEAQSASLLETYLDAKEAVVAAGYAAEVDWQYEVLGHEISETDLLREGAWVILSAGLSARVVAARFEAVSKAFFDWESAVLIAVFGEECRSEGLRAFNNPVKLTGIVKLAQAVAVMGWECARARAASAPIEFFGDLPHIGPTTKYHLAKNLGIDVAKPDRHLTRIASAAGFKSVESLCTALANLSSDPPAVVDLVLWRFATLRTNYLSAFRPAIEVPAASNP